MYFVLTVLKEAKSVRLSSKVIYNYHLGEKENSLYGVIRPDAIDMTFMTWQMERELLYMYLNCIRMRKKLSAMKHGALRCNF